MQDLGVKCMKVVLLLFNAIALVVGISLVATGTYIRSQQLGHGVILDGPVFKMTPILLITIGAIITFIASFGLYGTCADNRMFVIIYGYLILIIFIVEVGAGLAGVILSAEVGKLLSNYLYQTMNNEADWSITQTRYNCCGVNGPNDWLAFYRFMDSNAVTNSTVTNSTVTNSTTTNSPVTNSTDTNSTVTNSSPYSLPSSCCASTFNECNVTTSYSQGCLKTWVVFLKDDMVIIVAVGFTLAFGQIVELILAFYVAKGLKEEYEAIK